MVGRFFGSPSALSGLGQAGEELPAKMDGELIDRRPLELPQQRVAIVGLRPRGRAHVLREPIGKDREAAADDRRHAVARRLEL